MIVIRKIPEQAKDLVKKYESLRLKRYICPAGYPTIGWGHVLRDDTKSINVESAIQFLEEDLKKSALSVLRLTKVSLSDNQYSALISFVFNLGGGAYQRSTLRMKLNREDYIGASKEFKKWCRAGNEILNGLVNRRKEEAELFLA
jgi:lysozyme